MAYDADVAQPICILPAPIGHKANVPAFWYYRSEDAAAVVDADGYITDGQDLGMKVGDIVYVEDSNASPVIVTVHRVTSLSTTDRSVDLSNGDTLITGTDSD